MNQAIYHSSPTSEPIHCEISLAEGKVYIYFKESNSNMLIWDLKSLESCSLIGGALKIIKEKVPGQTLHCSGNIGRQIYEAYSHPKEEKHPGHPKKIIAFFTLTILALLGLCMIIYIYLLPWIAGKATGLVSQDLEITLGNSLSEAYLKEGSINDSATYYSNQFVKQLNLQTSYPIHIYVIESKEINAFAVPGGNIFVYSGLLDKLNTYEEYVALLSHEATHVIKRHALKSILSSATSGLLISYFFGDIAGLTGWAVSKADEFKQLDYSRDLETEADQNGLQLMISNQVSPKGMRDLLEVLKKEGQTMPGLMKYFSTHPDTEARIGLVSRDPLIGKVFEQNEKLNSSFLRIKKLL